MVEFYSDIMRKLKVLIENLYLLSVKMLLCLILKVSLEMFCYSKPNYVTGNNFKYISNNVMDVMKTNLNKKSLQFQYISLKSGLYFNYPATLLTDCESYDPRFR